MGVFIPKIVKDKNISNGVKVTRRSELLTITSMLIVGDHKKVFFVNRKSYPCILSKNNIEKIDIKELTAKVVCQLFGMKHM